MIAAHADWSVSDTKRWVTIGKRHRGVWVLDAPRLIGELTHFFDRLSAAAGGEPAVFGIDCPIGLPAAYARQLDGVVDFPAFLRGLEPDCAFFNVARTIEEVSLARPFFPAGTVSGMGYKLRLARALGLEGPAALSRMSDRATANRPAGGQLFWTLGANQCGKAAISAWRDLLIPGMRRLNVGLWPFDGALLALARPGRIAVAETYPAEAMRQLGLKLAASKQSQGARQALGGQIFAVLDRLGVQPCAELSLAIGTGFGGSGVGEDMFDSLMGVLGVINVLNGNRPDSPPCPTDRWEGWVLGQTDLPTARDFGF